MILVMMLKVLVVVLSMWFMVCIWVLIVLLVNGVLGVMLMIWLGLIWVKIFMGSRVCILSGLVCVIFSMGFLVLLLFISVLG